MLTDSKKYGTSEVSAPDCSWGSDTEKLRVVAARTRRRLALTFVTIGCYFAFVINWTAPGAGLREPLGGHPATGSLLMFAGLILLFLSMELGFLFAYLGSRRRGNNA
ncbi:MAG: hypothetical protein RIC38_08735 [Chromatocurvus sp.]